MGGQSPCMQWPRSRLALNEPGPGPGPRGQARLARPGQAWLGMDTWTRLGIY